MRVRIAWIGGIAVAALCNVGYGALHFREDPEAALGHFAASVAMVVVTVGIARPWEACGKRQERREAGAREDAAASLTGR